MIITILLLTMMLISGCKYNDIFDKNTQNTFCENNELEFKHHGLETLTCINKTSGEIIDFEKDYTTRLIGGK